MSKQGTRRRQLTVGAGVGIGAFAIAPAADGAVVTNTNNAGAGSLRQAVLDTNADMPVDNAITFQAGLTGTIALTTGQLLITDGVTITGPGPGAITVSGEYNSRIFETNPATSGETVEISGLTLTKGDSPTGGAILNPDAALNVTNSAIVNNHSDSIGGGIAHQGLDLPAEGSNNLLLRSTISGNTAEDGGGIAAINYFGFIDSSTIAGNEALEPNVIGGTYLGGGINAGDGGGMSNTTVAGNYAEDGGGGVFASATASTVVFNSIIADNTRNPASMTGFGSDVRGNFDAAFSLFENTGGTGVTITENPATAGSLITGVDPLLGPLAANGGSTPTKRPSPCGPAADKGGLTGATATDQRGFGRVVELAPANSTAVGANGADIGAVELTLQEGQGLCPASGGTVVNPPVTKTPARTPAAKCKKKTKTKGKSASAAAKCKKKKKKK